MFADTDALAKDLEKGIGEVEPLFQAIRESMRLRVEGPCGIAALALQHHLYNQGVSSELVISRPNITADPNLHHAFLVAETGDVDVVIDPTYSQLLNLAGMSEGYVLHGGVDRFPDERIATFPISERGKIAADLAAIAKICIDTYEPIQARGFNNRIEFAGVSEDDIRTQLTRFWNPDYFEVLTLPDYYEDRASHLADHIDPKHARIVA